MFLLLLRYLLLSHAGPYVGVHNIGVFHRFVGGLDHPTISPGFQGQASCLAACRTSLPWLIPPADTPIATSIPVFAPPKSGECIDIIAVSNEGQLDALKGFLVFQYGHQIPHYLTGDEEIGQAVDNRNGGMFRQFQDLVMTEGPGSLSVEIPGQG